MMFSRKSIILPTQPFQHLPSIIIPSDLPFPTFSHAVSFPNTSNLFPQKKSLLEHLEYLKFNNTYTTLIINKND